MTGKYGRKASSRHNRRKGTGLIRLFAVLALCGLIGGGAYYAGRSSFFGLKEIVFHGNKQMSVGELRKMMGISEGQNMFSISSEELSERLLGSPWITETWVRKEFPGRLRVRVEEAVPQALLKDKSGTFLVDRRGMVLEKLGAEPVSFLPIVVDLSGGRTGAFQEALALAGVIRETGLAAESGSVEIRGFEKGPENITVTIDGLKARVGGGMYRAKLSKLFELRDEIRRREIDVDYVDLRFNDRVVVKPVSAVAKVARTEGIPDGR